MTTPQNDDTKPGNIKVNRQVLTGNNVEIWFSNKKIGYLRNFSGQNDYGLQPLAGIGDGHVQEWVPTLAQHHLTADRAVIRKASMMSIMGKDSSSSDSTQNPFINMDGALQGKVFDVAIQQKDDGALHGKIVRWWRRCSLASDQVTVGTNAIIYNNITMHALDVREDMTGTFNQNEQTSDMDEVKSGA